MGDRIGKGLDDIPAEPLNPKNHVPEPADMGNSDANAQDKVPLESSLRLPNDFIPLALEILNQIVIVYYPVLQLVLPGLLGL